MDDWFAPCATAVILVGTDAKLIRRVGFQVINDCVACWASLVDPIPVSLSVADSVESDGEKGEMPLPTARWLDCLKTALGAPQGSIFGPLYFNFICLYGMFVVVFFKFSIAWLCFSNKLIWPCLHSLTFMKHRGYICNLTRGNR